MTKDEARSLIDDFMASSDVQERVEQALNYCSQLSAAVAELQGFHDDEARLDAAVVSPDGLRVWLDAQLLQAELARIVSEAGEAVENLRKPGPDSHCPEYPGWHVELIDILHRVFDTLGKRGVSPGEIFLAKLRYNLARPFMHGKTS